MKINQYACNLCQMRFPSDMNYEPMGVGLALLDGKARNFIDANTPAGRFTVCTDGLPADIHICQCCLAGLQHIIINVLPVPVGLKLPNNT